MADIIHNETRFVPHRYGVLANKKKIAKSNTTKVLRKLSRRGGSKSQQRLRSSNPLGTKVSSYQLHSAFHVNASAIATITVAIRIDFQLAEKQQRARLNLLR